MKRGGFNATGLFRRCAAGAGRPGTPHATSLVPGNNGGHMSDDRCDADRPLRDAEAVVLVGGQGLRLRPLTLSAPKPMLPTAGLPFLTHLLSRIAAAGIEHVILGTSYKAGVFESEFGDGSKLGLQIDYVVEDEPLGTGGGIANVSSKLRHDTALVFNGDVLSGADLRALLASHES